MDLSTRLRRWALGRPRVLIVDGPGAAELRWDVEAEIDRRGWVLAESPAGTDILLTVGGLGAELGRAVDVLWSQVPTPRHRASVGSGPVGGQLDAAATALLSPDAWEPAEDASVLLEGRGAGGHGNHDGGHGNHDGGHGDGHDDGHGDHDRGHGDHGGDHDDGHDDGHGDHGDHGDHGGDHGGMVAGLPMAETSPDRDGLTLDRLTVRLGPVLPGWPTGLVLRAGLQGDVLGEVELSWADGQAPTPPAPTDPRMRALDSVHRFLAVAGWPAAAREARAAREALRSGTDPAAARWRADRITRQVTRSRALAWSVGGIAPSVGLGGDALDRVRRWCDIARGAEPAATGAVALAELAATLEGLELAAARLAVASVELRASHVPAVAGAGHG